jgi:hypothetical protein
LDHLIDIFLRCLEGNSSYAVDSQGLTWIYFKAEQDNFHQLQVISSLLQANLHAKFHHANELLIRWPAKVNVYDQITQVKEHFSPHASENDPGQIISL